MIQKIRGYFSGLFRDPVAAEAKFFVDAATINAIGASRQIFLTFDELKSADIAQSDFIITTASIHVGLAQLELSQMVEVKKVELRTAIFQSLREWGGENAEKALEDCRAFFEKNYPTIVANSDNQEFAGSDTLGFWIVWNLIGQGANGQRKLIRTVGALCAVPFSKWWAERKLNEPEVRGFPWPSFLWLLYPITAALVTRPTAGITSLAIGVSNLSFLLFAAGVYAGTFRIFGLRNRWQVFAAAVVCFLIGFVLSNPHAFPLS